MRMKLFLAALVLGSMASPALSQAKYEPSGILKGVATNWVSIWSRAGNDTQIGVRYKHEDVRFSDEMCGVWLRNFDFNTNTTDNYRLTVHFETGMATHTINQTAVYTSGNMPIVTTPVTVTFAPIALHGANQGNGEDLYLGINKLQPWATGNDGGWVYFTRGTTAAGTFDMPGVRLLNTGITVPDRILFGRSNSTAAFGSSGNAWHVWAQPMHDPNKGIAGTAVAKTNQTTQRGRGGDQTISGLMSGMHPDTNNHNATTPPRADSWGFCVEGNCVKQGDIAVFLLSLGWFPVKSGLPLPGVKGRLHINPNFLLIQAAPTVSMTNSAGQMVWGSKFLLPDLGGALAGGTDVYWQAGVIRPSTGALIGLSGASVQKL